ncbi:MAG: hypothetical protein HDQ88_12535 [Clostridia bacterium]|nr:hypothetical protein [Clostridia bacterium]
MDKETQDLLWACLSKEERDEIRKIYTENDHDYTEHSDYFYGGRADATEWLLGLHNLTSDTEPEEMLVVEREKVVERYRHFLIRETEEVGSNNLWQARQVFSKCAAEFHSLFGDKCLPDKEKPKPKFKVGDKIRVVELYHDGSGHEYMAMTGEVIAVGKNHCDIFNGLIEVSLPKYMLEVIEPYTEEPRNLSQETANRDKSKDNQLKDNMEEKELNLVELLKGCEGETFYSRAYGEVALNEIVRDYRPNAPEIKVYTPDPQSDRVWFLRDGRKHRNGKVDLYPSEDLLKKYPFDGRAAWQEWLEARKPKRWRAKSSSGWAVSECEGHWEDYTYWYITSDGVIAQDEETNCKADNLRHELGNYFRTEELAKQAAEGIREYLKKFHEKNSEK